MAALVRHYFFRQDLPVIEDEMEEFGALAAFLQLARPKAEAEQGERLLVCDALNW